MGTSFRAGSRNLKWGGGGGGGGGGGAKNYTPSQKGPSLTICIVYVVVTLSVSHPTLRVPHVPSVDRAHPSVSATCAVSVDDPSYYVINFMASPSVAAVQSPAVATTRKFITGA